MKSRKVKKLFAHEALTLPSSKKSRLGFVKNTIGDDMVDMTITPLGVLIQINGFESLVPWPNCRQVDLFPEEIEAERGPGRPKKEVA